MKYSYEALEARYNKLATNGKNIEGQGVMRKLKRKMRALESKKEK